ncbi:MAG: hypothetical protein EA377_04415 [Phycisphaerales bacterium]|nr:MAG: hypothetical protein EA377_04415 [Phycisphaerales bacterium]
MSSRNPPRSLSKHQTAHLLQHGLTVPVRPIDTLLDHLTAPNGWEWLETALREEFSEAERAMALAGGDDSPDSESRLVALKERAKTLVAEAPTEDRALAAMAMYCLTVASGLVHHGQLHSSRGPAEWSEVFADLAGVAFPQWRSILLQAAEEALLRSTA